MKRNNCQTTKRNKGANLEKPGHNGSMKRNSCEAAIRLPPESAFAVEFLKGLLLNRYTNRYLADRLRQCGWNQ